MLTRESETSHYRAKAYCKDSTGCRYPDYRYLSFDGDIRELDNWLDKQVSDGRATGGAVEAYVGGFGWTLYNDEDE